MHWLAHGIEHEDADVDVFHVVRDRCHLCEGTQQQYSRSIRTQVHRLVNSPAALSPSPLRKRHLTAALRVLDTLYAEATTGAATGSTIADRIVITSAVRSLFDMCADGTGSHAAAWTWLWATRLFSGIRAQVLTMAEAQGRIRCLSDDSALHRELSMPWSLALRMLRHPKQDEVLRVLSKMPAEAAFGHQGERPGVADTHSDDKRRATEKPRPSGVLSARQLSCLQVPKP